MKPLVSAEAYAHVLTPLLGKRIGYVRPLGNTGDQLIEMATFQLFDAYGIRWRQVAPREASNCDELVFAGGGNMGSLYSANYDLRTECLATGLPVTILPQSFTSAEDRPFARVFVRERKSLEIFPSAVLAPDMALGLNYRTTTRPRHDRGVFLRRDRESSAPRSWFRRLRNDPARLCRLPVEYLELAAQYRHIITDRLHFAIGGLIVGRRVTLVGNSYFKNAAMHDAWLRPLGCEFVDAIPSTTAQVANYLWRFWKWTSHAPSVQVSTLPNM